MGGEEGAGGPGVRDDRALRGAGGLDQRRRGRAGGAQRRLAGEQALAMRAENAERREGVVLGEACERVEAGHARIGSSGRFGVAARSQFGSREHQLGSRERRRAKVQTSTWSATSVAEPSTTWPPGIGRHRIELGAEFDRDLRRAVLHAGLDDLGAVIETSVTIMR